MQEPIAAAPTCAHHWVLAAPSGDTTAGVCKLCGAVRDFNDAYKAPVRTLRGAPRKA